MTSPVSHDGESVTHPAVNPRHHSPTCGILGSSGGVESPGGVTEASSYHQQPSAYEQASPESSHRPQTITIPKNKSASNLLAQGSDSIAADAPLPKARLSVDAGTEAYDNLTSNGNSNKFSSNDMSNGQAPQTCTNICLLPRSPILSADRETGLRRIRQNPSRNPSSPNLSALHSAAPLPEPGHDSRKASLALLTGPSSPTLPCSEDLARQDRLGRNLSAHCECSGEARRRRRALEHDGAATKSEYDGHG
ncbi:hypothetical protein KC325_g86 [Hortaea werneckii]|nr:hypothetical protein KC325_g86 [Hortaea werneckii]